MSIVDRFSRAAFLVITLLVLLPMPAQAELLLTATATNGSISANGSTDIKVYATSDSTDNIGQFNIAFDIRPDGSNANTPLASLQFLSPDPSNDSTLINNSYIYNPSNGNFAGDASFQADTGSAFGVATDPDSTGYDTHFAGSDIYDGSDNNGYVVLTSSTTVLLADLVVTFSPQYTTNPAGDLFDITVQLSGTAFGDGSGGSSTVASPADGATIAQVLVTPTQQPTNPIPEPNTMTLALIGGVAIAAGGTFRKGKPKRVQEKGTGIVSVTS